MVEVSYFPPRGATLSNTFENDSAVRGVLNGTDGDNLLFLSDSAPRSIDSSESTVHERPLYRDWRGDGQAMGDNPPWSPSDTLRGCGRNLISPEIG